MKKIYQNFIGIMLAILLVFSVVGCSNGGDSGSVKEDPSLTLNVIEKTLYVDESFTLTATMKNVEGKVTFSSSDEEIAGVTEQGVVTGVAAGQATITVRVGELSEHCAVTVLNSEVPVLKAGISSQVVYVGFTRQITANVYKNGELLSPAPTIEYASSAQEIATVSADGVITGVAIGDAKITVKATVNGENLTKTFDISVKNMRVIAIQEEVTLGAQDEIYADDYPRSCKMELTGYIDGIEINDNTQVEWSVADIEIAEISADGVVTAKKQGVTTITAKKGTCSASSMLNVVSQARTQEINAYNTESKMKLFSAANFGGPDGRVQSTTYVTGTVGGRTSETGGFMKVEYRISNKQGNAERLTLNLGFEQTVTELEKSYNAGYTEIIIPMYMQYMDDTWKTAKQPVEYKSVRESHAARHAIDFGVDGFNPTGWQGNNDFPVGYLHNEKWNLFEYDLAWLIACMRAEVVTNKIELSIVCWKDSEGGCTDIDVYVDGMYAIRGETIVAFDCDNHSGEISNDRFISAKGKIAGNDAVSFVCETEDIGGRSATGAGFVGYQYTAPSTASASDTATFGYEVYYGLINEFVTSLTTLKNAGYTKVRFDLFLKITGTDSYTLKDALASDETAKSIAANTWISVDITIDEVISRLQNRPLGRPYLFAWQIGNAGNVNYELLFDSIIAVKE